MENQPPSQKQSSKPYLRRLFGTLISLLLLVVVVASQGVGEFLQALITIPFPYVAAAIGLTLLSRLFTIARWFVLLRAASAPLGILPASRLVFMGLFASNFLPTTIGGDVVRLAGAIKFKVDAGVSIASLVVDRLVGSAGMAFMLPFGLPLLIQRVNGVGLIFPFFLGAGNALGTAWQKFLRLMAQTWKSALLWVRKPTSLGLSLLCSFGHMACTFASVALLLSGLNEPLSFWTIGGLWSIAYFVSLIPVSINGLGLQEISITYIFSELGGISLPSALALAVLMRLMFLVASLPGAFFLPELLELTKKEPAAP